VAKNIEQLAAQLSRFYNRTSLGNFPTPVMATSLFGLEAHPPIWVKRDDLSSNVYGGNKIRKLEFLLKTSERPVLTFGPLGSHHVYATALHAKTLGRSTAAILVPQPMTPHHRMIHDKILKICNPVIVLSAKPSSWAALFKTIATPIMGRSAPYQICPPGGSNPLGTLGYVLGALELAAQINAGQLPEPQKIFVPLGTGGTSVGIAIGLAMAGLTTETMAVRVVPEIALPNAMLSLLMTRTLRLIRKTGLPAPGRHHIRFTVQTGFSTQYAITNPQADNAMQLAEDVGIPLETTYSAKAMAALIFHARTAPPSDGPYLFWQTFADVCNEPA
jgi:1-aminocyclopropane-1-carboxylate deaminase/D-cysteine desulfhydrase-like pyridoxal-dependent ACC family enzyme